MKKFDSVDALSFAKLVKDTLAEIVVDGTLRVQNRTENGFTIHDLTRYLRNLPQFVNDPDNGIMGTNLPHDVVRVLVSDWMDSNMAENGWMVRTATVKDLDTSLDFNGNYPQWFCPEPDDSNLPDDDEWSPSTSSMIKRFHCDVETKELLVEFRASGDVYRYEPVDAAIFVEMAKINARQMAGGVDSLGAWFVANIKGNSDIDYDQIV